MAQSLLPPTAAEKRERESGAVPPEPPVKGLRAGSLTTALSPNLGVLLLGWSLLEGIGAALIMSAIVALVAGNFPPERRSSAYELIAAAGAIAVAAGPLIGGAVTTLASWRYVFVGEVVVVIMILVLARRIHDAPRPSGITSAPSSPYSDWDWPSLGCYARANGDGLRRNQAVRRCLECRQLHG